ncbi:hypothetical protein MSAN_02126900 [Mycena sanguinolenta]|uniref:BTB domain-containing protein n=1 Tax=Mycena sanguinolenta TaxID=230812 RepID=A0A8H7CK12_9AGAR|nr:hypothetical protein MSAN_02126900 [Mycena sanguinolenta]
MDSAPSTKRPRVDDGPSSSVIRSKVWYSDGSVVLQAETTQFRVHASILSAASAVFKDMFQIAQAPSNADSQVEGCPLVQLYDDTAQDVELVLGTLYDRTFYKEQEKPFALVAAMLRLGQKYEFDQLREDAVSRLERRFPTTLPLFRAGADLSGIAEYPGLVYDAINLARTAGLPSILPAALYAACTSSGKLAEIQKNILHGLPRADGKLVQLTSEDKALCILATTAMLETQCGVKTPYFQHRECIAAFDNISMFPSVLRIGSAVPARMCKHCTAAAQTSMIAVEQQLWDRLPELFGLQPWKEIQK